MAESGSLVTFLAVEKSDSPLGEIAARRAKKAAACKANYELPLQSVGGSKYRLGSFGMTFFVLKL
ncbi:hypothetical protein [Psychrosphaera algicola]|uniref:Uncharacterized protein n=1 Tax=Psychrosphaera algicola TaxID=3023714 RepID=A0ABT5FIH3_9GAMM|nr:hypothetical protein [Psychrosphaera sp. G1-22]MDC2890987.1 hypothetical protein [Psychrosphaera sp. G1-22]